MPEIIFQNSRLSSTFPKKNPTAHSKGLSSDTANPWATTLPLSNTQELTTRPPIYVNFNGFPSLNQYLLARYWLSLRLEVIE